MARTFMDTHPHPLALAEAHGEAPRPNRTDSPTPTFISPPPRENPLLEILIGPTGLSPATRWLIYLALCGVVLGFLGAFRHFVHRPRVSSVWWGLFSEAGLALAVILPGFVMAFLENRRF